MNNFLFVTQLKNMNGLQEHTPTLVNVDLETFRVEMPVTASGLEGQYFKEEFAKFERYSALVLPGILNNLEQFNRAIADIKRHGVMFKTIFLDVKDARYAWDFQRSYDQFVYPRKGSVDTQGRTNAFNSFPKSIFVNHWH